MVVSDWKEATTMDGNTLRGWMEGSNPGITWETSKASGCHSSKV